MGRARNAMEDAFARAAAGGGAITLRSANKRPAAGQPEDGEPGFFGCYFCCYVEGGDFKFLDTACFWLSAYRSKGSSGCV
jgi:hypothetical protein